MADDMIKENEINAAAIEHGVRPENLVWGEEYKNMEVATPSWNKHGMPDLADKFVDLVKSSDLKGTHLDIGCGSGIKTVGFAVRGLESIGIDQSEGSFHEGLLAAKTDGVDIKLIKATCNKIPLGEGVASSVSDILMGTHVEPEIWEDYISEVKRVLKPGGYLLFVLFSSEDEHFHGVKVKDRGNNRYNYKLENADPALEPELDRYTSYGDGKGMYNIHFDDAEIDSQFSPHFEIIEKALVQHPVYPHRKLWNVIMRYPDGQSSSN
jgi:SAM-dependent methyltransferase